ncbi:hypothetical protein A7P53_11125 [Acinetobacter defluvii]|uniref:KOW domain-containing protein n=1 Tax=Acinetobacter defluvii TaxID=1871111 RepID=A0A2S2FG83_9GAMM|nr:hypothetical protein [Acinetobacter defluvii]AWL29976.1 hypothetical protein DJ533_16085 [Acinetobacter defluvii]NNP73116.1 hypothetical protein [Acinetobacter defluvii]
MRVEIEGLQQGSIEVELQIIPRVGETVKVMYGADAEVKGEVTEVEHYINQHANDQKVILTIRPLY